MRKRSFVRMSSIVFFAVASIAGTTALLADDADDLIKYRQAGMKVLGGHIGSIVPVVKGKVADQGHLAMHAAGLAAQAEVLLDLFPKGSDHGETNAKPNIWENWDDFKTKAENLRRESAKLAELGKAGDVNGFKEQVGAVGKTCKGCHDDYRKEKK